MIKFLKNFFLNTMDHLHYVGFTMILKAPNPPLVKHSNFSGFELEGCSTKEKSRSLSQNGAQTTETKPRRGVLPSIYRFGGENTDHVKCGAAEIHRLFYGGFCLF